MAAKVQVKLYAEQERLETEPFIRLFHEWIRDDALGELLIDVADYRHVQNGPGIALIGHAADYFLDVQDGRPGILCSLKRYDSEELSEQLTSVFERALKACALAADANLGTFGQSEVVFRFLDRLRFPNNAETWAAVSPVVASVVEAKWGGTASLKQEGESRAPLAVHAQIRS